MAQVNFRIDHSLKLIIDEIAKEKGTSVAQIAKSALLNEIEPIRIDIAFRLVKEGKIGRKKAWQISGLDYPGFLKEWSKRKAHENIVGDHIDEELTNLKELISSKRISMYFKED